eukprot:6063549-Pyramimonas_sp.AAC.1
MGRGHDPVAVTRRRRLHPRWAKQFLPVPGGASKGSWLDSRWKQGLGVGCKCCHASGLPGFLGRAPFNLQVLCSCATS